MGRPVKLSVVTHAIAPTQSTALVNGGVKARMVRTTTTTMMRCDDDVVIPADSAVK